MIKQSIIISLVTGLLDAATINANEDTPIIETGVTPFSETSITKYDGSQFHTYFSGRTQSTQNALSGIAIIEPNNEIHPAHQHTEEEYLYILEGSGTWELNGEKFAAKQGDMLYTEPCASHGLFNSGTTPLKFIVWKAGPSSATDANGKPFAKTCDVSTSE